MIRFGSFFVSLTLALSACSAQGEATTAPIPSDAVSVDGSALATEDLAAFANLGPDDRLFEMPTVEDRAVLIRTRDGEPPLLFGTSCDVVSATPLPSGWAGGCLEYTSHGQRMLGEFPYGTVSN